MATKTCYNYQSSLTHHALVLHYNMAWFQINLSQNHWSHAKLHVKQQGSQKKNPCKLGRLLC
jgi:hypothetical protein